MKLGVIGGLGPETAMGFCLRIINRITEMTGRQPEIMLENVPLSTVDAEALICGGGSETAKTLLKNAVRNLGTADLIVIPCNTVHFMIEELRASSEKPIVSIIECMNEFCKKNKIRKAGLLATSKTIKENLYNFTEIITPKNQEAVDNIILNILKGEDAGKELSEQINEMKDVEAVILGCTDLQIAIEDSNIKIIDSLRVLEDHVVGLITKC